jgi:hypothetical protein
MKSPIGLLRLARAIAEEAIGSLKVIFVYYLHKLQRRATQGLIRDAENRLVS